MEREPLSWRTETRRVRDLVPWQGNPRKISEGQAEQLERSLKKFGLADIPVIDADGTIVGGHQRAAILMARGRGDEEIDVRVPSRKLTDEEYRELNLRLNRNLGEWDFDLLANFAAEVLEEVGFESREIDRIFDLVPKKDRHDATEAYAGATGTGISAGDVFALGDHRLVCGDATSSEIWPRLMAGDLADLVLTDPPYNVNYQGRGKKTSVRIAGDNLPEQQFREMLERAFRQAHIHSGFAAPLYTCYASRTHREFEDALNAAGWEVRNQIIWIKTVASMGWGDYRWKHEPILYCKKAGATAAFYGDRKQYTEWREYKDDEELLRCVRRMLEKEEKGGSTVWRLARDNDPDHPTQKPVELYHIAIENSTARHGIVVDPFAGAGTLFVAAEQMDRRAFMLEIDPRWCEVIIKRWESTTAKHAEKLEVA